MPLTLVRNDITKMETDAIVNAANHSLLGGGGVDGAIHLAAGPQLLEECRTLQGCKTGEAKVTNGYQLKAKYVIHTVGPVYQDGMHGEDVLLSSCYRNSLLAASGLGLNSVSFPLISAGAYGYPEREAIRIAVRTISAFLEEHEMDVYLVFFARSVFEKSKDEYPDLDERIEKISRAEEKKVERKARKRREAFKNSALVFHEPADEDLPAPSFDIFEKNESVCYSMSAGNLDDRLKQLDESFTEMLFRKIDERGIKDSECYKKANLDRKLFSKIRSNVHYRPKKNTALALAIALRLSLPETEELLKKAGFALSDSNVSDVIIRYFIEKGIYDIFEINEALFRYDQVQLGA